MKTILEYKKENKKDSKQNNTQMYLKWKSVFKDNYVRQLSVIFLSQSCSIQKSYQNFTFHIKPQTVGLVDNITK